MGAINMGDTVDWVININKTYNKIVQVQTPVVNPELWAHADDITRTTLRQPIMRHLVKLV